MIVNADGLKASLMESNERDGPAFKMAKDPRVTSVGRFLRKVGIDELPQLWNVLIGDMALVDLALCHATKMLNVCHGKSVA